MLPLRSGTRQGYSLSSLLFDIVLKVLTRGIIQENKKIQTGDEGVKVSLFTDMILYVSDHKDTTQNLIELINTFRKVSRHKINTKISSLLIYSCQTFWKRNQRDNPVYNRQINTCV